MLDGKDASYLAVARCGPGSPFCIRRARDLRDRTIADTTSIARAHAEIWAELENDGNLIGAHDLWIAATALSHGMDVATANARDFGGVLGFNVGPV